LKKKPKKKDSEDKHHILTDLLKKHGAQIYDDLDKGNFPKFSIPSRSVSNIVYDKKIRITTSFIYAINVVGIFC